MEVLELNNASMACAMVLGSRDVPHGRSFHQALLANSLAESAKPHASDPCNGCPSMTTEQERQSVVTSRDAKRKMVHTARHVSPAGDHTENASEDNALWGRAIWLAEEVLDGVLRNDAVAPRDQLRKLQEVCRKSDGWIVEGAMSRCGAWNGRLRRMAMMPPIADAIRHLAVAISSVQLSASSSSLQPPQPQTSSASPFASSSSDSSGSSASASASLAGANNDALFVSVDAARSAAAACSLHTPKAILLSSALRLASLRAVSLCDQQLSAGRLAAVLPALCACPSLAQLDLSRNPLQATGAALLASHLRDPASPLRDLDLSACHLPTRACVTLLDAALEALSLRSLSLASNDVGSPGAAAAAALLRADSPLEALNLTCAGISAPGMEALASAAMENSRLEALLLEGNHPHSYSLRWRGVIGQHPHLHHLAIDDPVHIEGESELLASLAGTRGPAVPRESMLLAVGMGLHGRLGAGSLLRLLPHHLLEVVFASLATQFRLDLLQYAPACDDARCEEE